MDVFAEEWEASKRDQQVDALEVCRSIRCLLSPSGGPTTPADWALPAPHSERQTAAQAIRCLLAVRNMYIDMQAAVRAADSALSPEEHGQLPRDPQVLDNMPSPLEVPDETADGHKEGVAFPLLRQDRIVCGAVSRDSRQTRYLMLHNFSLLLVQPDVLNPGWGVVRSLCPVRHVEPKIDRADPRTVRLSMRLTKDQQGPGEATPVDAAPGEETKGSSFFQLILSFEDVRRAQTAEHHLRSRRMEVRVAVRQRIEAFVESLC